MGEYERIVGKLSRRQLLCRQHQLERFSALTDRGGDEVAQTPRPVAGSNGKQADLAHLRSPIQLARPQHAVARAI